ncbi:MAG: hypothetical protein H6738_01185 [Alphaproteobacteria bacterium]|nr:hypothetical protein [Alphaproteobacteria bacterium]
MLLIGALACTGDDGTSPTDTPAPHETGGPTAETGSTGVTRHTGGHSAAPTSWPEVRCSELVAAPLAATLLDQPRATHDVAFDPEGRLVGSDGNALIRWPHEGPGTPWVPAVGPIHQVDWLADGGLAVTVATTSFLERVDPGTGGRTVLAAGVPAYALRTGPDGWLWIADGQTLARVDPASGQREVLVATLPDGRPKVVGFDRRAHHAYLGTVGGTGTVYRIPLDRSGAVAGPPEPFATGIGGGWHDALVVDACDNVYVTDAVTTSIVRIDAAGTPTVVLDPPTEGHAHGLRFGSGVGGWRSDALYAALPYGGNRVAEIVVGVPGADFEDGRYVVVD